MIGELVIRFLLGGAVVSAFAALGELFQPKTFAGLFGAAPSVAIATLALAFGKHGPTYAAVEARSMVLGSAALFVYSAACVALSRRRPIPVWLGAGVAWGLWFLVAFPPVRARGGGGRRAMKPALEPGRLKQTRAWEYLVRFAFGGLVTVATGLVAHRWGAWGRGAVPRVPVDPPGEPDARAAARRPGVRGRRRARRAVRAGARSSRMMAVLAGLQIM